MSEEEEFEFRARAEAEAVQARQNAQQTQQAAPGAVPGQGPVSPGMLEQAGNFITQTAIPTAYGVGAAAANVAASHPYLTAGAAAMLPNSVLNKIPGGQKIAAGKEFFSNLGNAAQAYAQKEARLQNRPGFGGTGPGATGVSTGPGGAFAGQGTVPGAAAGTAPTQQPSIIQRGMDMASRMRQAAAQRVMPMAGVPGAVGLGGAAATGLAGGQMAAMTPEQRKAYYDSMMMGAMSGDAGLAAAIMNRGQ